MSAKALINEDSMENMSKEKLRKFIKDVLKSELEKPSQKIMSEDDVRTLIRQMLKKQFRMIWEKSAFFTDKL